MGSTLVGYQPCPLILGYGEVSSTLAYISAVFTAVVNITVRGPRSYVIQLFFFVTDMEISVFSLLTPREDFFQFKTR
jgi:hypothetical protein